MAPLEGLRQRLDIAGRVSGEVVVAWIRVAMGVSMFSVLVAGDELDRYPGAAWTVLLGAIAYSWIALLHVTREARRGEVSRLTVFVLTASDVALIVTLTGLTGGASSPMLPILPVVGISQAVRFDLIQALVVSILSSAVLVPVLLLAPGPDRGRMAVWWTWMLISGAILAGMISEIAERAQQRRAEAEVEAREEKRRLDNEQRLRRQLESIDAHRVDFLRALAHDFKTPIASLDALTEALSWDEHPLSDEQRNEVVSLIQTHTRHLSRLLGEVRDVANASSFGPEAQLEITDVFLPEVIRSAVATSGLGPARVLTTVEPDVRLIRTDSRKLARVLTNLLENAGRHAPASEPVEVTVRRAAGVDDVVELSVLDRGPGIPPELAAQVFEKFASFGEQRSSGLGMWIVSEFVGALGGGINLENRPGGGLAVRVLLPAERSVTPARPVLEQAEQP